MADGGKSTKAGRNKDKCAKYRAHKTREKNKLKRVLQSSGLEAAQDYAKEKALTSYLSSITKG